MARHLKPVVIALLVAVSGCAYFNTFYNARVHYRKAYNATRKRVTVNLSSTEITNYDKAVEKSLKLLNDYPNSSYVDDALLLLGKSYFYKGDYRQAIERFGELHTFYPESKLGNEADLYQARSFLELERFYSADSLLRLLLGEEIPKQIQASANYVLGDVLSKQRRFETAIPYYEKALDIGLPEEEATVYFKIAAAWDTLNAPSRAAQYFQKVESADPSWEMLFESKFRYGIMLRKLGEIEESIRLFQRLLSDDNNRASFARVKLEIGKSLLALSETGDAIRTYQDVITSHPRTKESAEAYYLLGKIYERDLADFEKAVACYQQVTLEFRTSVFSDSAEIKKLDIHRKMALEQVIAMADNGVEGTVDLQTIQAASDSLARQMIAEADSTRRQTEAAGGSDAFGDVNTQRQGTANAPRQAMNQPANLRRTAANTGGEAVVFYSDEQDRNLFLLAELNLLRFSRPDTALSLYNRIIKEFPESPFHVRALYNAVYTAGRHGLPGVTAEDYFRRLLELYPESEYAVRARKLMGLPVESRESTFISHFREAETALWDTGDYRKAYEMFASLAEEAAGDTLVPKTLFVMAYIQEHFFHSPDSARALYDTLRTRYPETAYAAAGTRKLMSRLPEQQAAADTAAAAPPDSVRAAVTADVAEREAGNDDRAPGRRDRRVIADDRPKTAEEVESGPVNGIQAILDQIIFPRTVLRSDLPDEMTLRVELDSRGRVVTAVPVNPTGKGEIDDTVIAAVKKVPFVPPPAPRPGDALTSVTISVPFANVILK
ncbi:tetratricopeptide repeat protein [bacterium]|nr:tetratricopeptide repeat protein [bacterium]